MFPILIYRWNAVCVFAARPILRIKNGILGFRQIFKDVFHVNRRENHPCSSFSV